LQSLGVNEQKFFASFFQKRSAFFLATATVFIAARIGLHPRQMSRGENFIYWLQALAARAGMSVFRFLPLDAASWLGGFLARKLGPLTGAHKTAATNLACAFPEKTESERQKILADMWDNIGRTVGEYPHLGKLMDDATRVRVEDPTGLAVKLRDDGRGALLVGMHFGNWELGTVPGHRGGLKQHHFYRAPNNPYIDQMLAKLRAPMRQEGYLPKGAKGARQSAMLLKDEAHIGMLVDQKQDEGIPVPFFGRNAMTTTAPAALARRMDVPIASARVIRQNGAHFLVRVQELTVTKTDNREADVIATTHQISAMLESWIREHPAQWFWVHRRWPRA
jgi:KDO2-lipid IV(A) lauroyltransferase